ncbi:MAG: DUF4190 domain-containing protein [Clostridiales bacterium]|nr:DUF4190 domain-containing protein [Clostridiales bacterium]
MFCNYCGKELENNALICHGCGSNTILGAQPAAPAPAPSADYATAQPTPAGKPNGMAVASMICGICGFICCGVSGIVGLILGIVAKKRIKQTGEGGNGFATAGIACGAVAAGFWLLYVVVLILGLVLAESFSGPVYPPTPDWLDNIYDGFEPMLNVIRFWGF